MSEFLNTPEERALLASELALGLLEGDALEHARRLQSGDRDFAALVDKAEREIAPLTEAYPAVAASEALKDRINAAIDAQEDVGSEAPRSVTANDNDLGPWRLIAMAASIVALALAGVLAFQAANQPASEQVSPATQYVAQLATQEEGQFVVVRWSADSTSLDVRTIGLENDSLAPELWIIPEDGTPRSFGTATGEGRGELEVSPELVPFLTDGATLAVTMEDPASAPHDAPTPPIIATGTLLEI